MDFAFSLPIDAALPKLLAALENSPRAVLVAPPGAGKTTRVPLALLDAPWRAGGRILMLEPRRVAARGAASRMAATLGEKLGQSIGLRARMDTQISNATVIEVVTEGVFARMILDDPMLEGIAAVLFDEFHERSLDADLGLALALDAQAGLREDLRLLVMSATLDGARVAGLMGDCPIIESEGRAFPIETRHLGRIPGARIEDQMADAVRTALREEAGSILAFLPGQGEIRRVFTLLQGRVGPEVDLCPLHGSLTPAEQDRAISPSAEGRRKVVLATSIAETSLTIEGVRVVIDGGLARVPRYEPDVGITRLETVRVSQAAAAQRRGRAGRTAPGVCYRLWHEVETQSFSAFARPEILDADLSGLLLATTGWGVADLATLPFLDPPPAGALAEARKLLIDLQALDSAGRLTPIGQDLSALPLPPRIAAMVLCAAEAGEEGQAAEIAALLVEPKLGGGAVDLETRLQNFRRDRSGRAGEMARLARRWAETARRRIDRRSGKATISQQLGSTGALLARAFPDRIAKARGGNPGAFLLANGRGVAMDAAEPLALQPFVVAAEIGGSAAAGRIFAAARIENTEIEAIFSNDIKTLDDVRFDRAAGALRARRQRRLGALALASQPIPVPETLDSAMILAKGAAETGLDRLNWSAHARQLRHRVAFLAAADPAAGWPEMSEKALMLAIDQWLAPRLVGKNTLAQISSSDLTEALESMLDFSLRRRLDEEAPTHFLAPTGQRHGIDYEGEGAPILAIRVQELFGLTSHPALARGRLPLTLHLLSPAQRPIQVTRDLPGFWNGSWAAVKSEMRGRYPRHPWPDDPANTAPTTRAKPRGT